MQVELNSSVYKAPSVCQNRRLFVTNSLLIPWLVGTEETGESVCFP